MAPVSAKHSPLCHISLQTRTLLSHAKVLKLFGNFRKQKQILSHHIQDPSKPDGVELQPCNTVSATVWHYTRTVTLIFSYFRIKNSSDLVLFL